MGHLLDNNKDFRQKINKKIYNLRVEKLIREASDNFIYFKDYDLVLNQIEEILEIEPDNVKAIILQGQTFVSLDKKEKALDCFELAINIDPFCSKSYGEKASLLQGFGKIKEALVSCNKAFEYSTTRNNELLCSLYDQKISLLIKMQKYKEAKQVLNKSYKSLKNEEIMHLASCYGNIIDILHKEKAKKQKLIEERFELVYS